MGCDGIHISDMITAGFCYVKYNAGNGSPAYFSIQHGHVPFKWIIVVPGDLKVVKILQTEASFCLICILIISLYLDLKVRIAV